VTDKQRIRILLIEDDEDDYRIIEDTLSEIHHVDFSVDWHSDIEEILEKTHHQGYDICLMDYRLGEWTGIDLMKDLIERGFDVPFIILTGYGDYDIDVLAMESGAADYLEKDNIHPSMLERAIRYAIERKRHMNALRISEQRLHVLSAKLVDAQEDERKRVAKEIHDGIGSTLVAIKYGLESIHARMRQNKPFREGLSIEQIVDYVKDTIDEAQRISSNLRPSILDDMGLSTAVQWICRRYKDIYPNIRIERRLEPEEIDVDPHLKVVLFRALQEAMNNVVKHSKADTVHLGIMKTDVQLALTVRDNGQGFNPEEEEGQNAESGVGLMGMRERIELSGGSLEIWSAKGKGCVIHAVWSLSQ
jgi:signal transduction histidine kinase